MIIKNVDQIEMMIGMYMGSFKKINFGKFLKSLKIFVGPLAVTTGVTANLQFPNPFHLENWSIQHRWLEKYLALRSEI